MTTIITDIASENMIDKKKQPKIFILLKKTLLQGIVLKKK